MHIICSASLFVTSHIHVYHLSLVIFSHVISHQCSHLYLSDCIERGKLLDGGGKTLEAPEEHSFHCLLDVSACYNSGFTVLGDKDEDTGLHCLGYRIDENDKVLNAARSLGKKGYCTSCTSSDNNAPEYGYIATVKGTIGELGDGSDEVSGTPLLINVEMLDETVGCDGKATTPPLCKSRSVQEVTTSSPTPSPIVVTTSSKPTGPVLDCPDTLEIMKEIDPIATLYYAVIPSEEGYDNGILCGRLEVESEGWIGLGFSPSGTMANSQAVIGIPNQDTVEKYDLAISRATPMTEDRQTLRDTSIDTADGTTTMTFTKLLVEDNEVEILEEGDNTFLFAWGGSNFGYHMSRKAFTIDLGSTVAPTDPPQTDSPTPNPTKMTPEPTQKAVETNSPTPSPITNTPTSSPTRITLSPTQGPTQAVKTSSPTPLPVETNIPITPSPITNSPTLSPTKITPSPIQRPFQADEFATVSSSVLTDAPSPANSSNEPTSLSTDTLTSSPTHVPSVSPVISESPSDSPVTSSPTRNPSVSPVTKLPSSSPIKATPSPTISQVDTTTTAATEQAVVDPWEEEEDTDVTTSPSSAMFTLEGDFPTEAPGDMTSGSPTQPSNWWQDQVTDPDGSDSNKAPFNRSCSLSLVVALAMFVVSCIVM